MVEKNLDLRSDTTTWPTPEMRRAAARAAVGDMGYGEDPTVNELEGLATDIFGKESGLFVTSGTQGNAVSVLAQTDRGDAIILGATSHIYLLSPGYWSIIDSLISRIVQEEEGWLPTEGIRQTTVGLGAGSRTSLLCLENTHCLSGGTPIIPDQMRADYVAAKEHDLSVHIDGARIFNASVALRIDVKDLARYSDTVMCCLSKGLAAPVGSVVVGPEETIERARRYGALLGGSIRQAGIIAAPGIIALTKMVDRLAEDHANAKLLGEGLERLGIKLHFPVRTNMLFIDYSGIGWSGEDWSGACAKLGWKSGGGPTGTRLVVHYGIEREDIEAFIDGLAELI